jgi:FAD synthetase
MHTLAPQRSHDPNSAEQSVFCPSSDGWPPFMRINPIFDWGYHDVWSFLLTTRVPYCCLYEHGYTSLGGRSNTQPNRWGLNAGPSHVLWCAV